MRLDTLFWPPLASPCTYAHELMQIHTHTDMVFEKGTLMTLKVTNVKFFDII